MTVENKTVDGPVPVMQQRKRAYHGQAAALQPRGAATSDALAKEAPYTGKISPTTKYHHRPPTHGMPGPLSPAELQEILGFTTELARKAGALMLEGSHAIQRAGAGGVGEKKNAVDLVTEYDVKVEELVRGEIARAYPHFRL
jgi:hypothetical protein